MAKPKTSLDTTSAAVTDLSNCDREPIHILGRVQSFGALVSVSSDWIINHASYNTYVRPMVERIGKAETVTAVCDVAARQLRALTGFDRVMVYKFQEDDSGMVISESLKRKVVGITCLPSQ